MLLCRLLVIDSLTGKIRSAANQQCLFVVRDARSYMDQNGHCVSMLTSFAPGTYVDAAIEAWCAAQVDLL